MERTKRKLILIVLCILLTLIFLVAGLFILQTNSVFAEENSESSDESTMQFDVAEYEGEKVYATYEFIQLNDTECSVRITNKSQATTANIPSTGNIDGKDYTVTEIALNGFVSSTNLVVVDLPKTIKKIGNMAFANCAKLKYIDLESVTEIGNNAFYRCPQLDLVVIPKTVQTIGSYVFRNNDTQVEVRATESACTNWTSTWISGNNNQDVHYNSKITTNPLAEVIKDNLARSGNAIKGFIIMKGQTNITDLDALDPEIFKNNDIVIPKEAEYTDGNKYPILAIYENAFSKSKFENLIIEYSELPILIGTTAFDSTQGQNVIINRTVEYKDIVGDNIGITKSSDNIFLFSEINSVVLPDNSEITEAMFAQCMNLNNIYFEAPSENPYTKGENEKEQLINKLNYLISQSDKIEIPAGVKTIGESAFNGATSISELHLTDKIESVGASILADWDSSTQKVYVHNENALPEYDFETGKGWHPQWHSGFTHVVFDKIFYKITFETEGYTLNLPDSKNYIYVEDGKQIVDLPTLNVYDYEKFLGWYLNDALITENTVFNFEKDITLVPKIIEKEFIVNLDPQGGFGGTAQVIAHFNEKMPQADAPYREKFRFNGYFSEVEGGGTKYYAASDSNAMISVHDWDIISDEPITLHAFWIPLYTITFDKRGGTGGTDSVEVAYGDAMPFAEAPVNGYYDFLGYYLEGDNNPYYKADMSSDRKMEMHNDITLYAMYRVMYKITYDLNVDNDFYATNDSRNPDRIAPETIKTLYEPYREHYGFDGWYLDGEKVTELSNINNGITLTAHWIGQKYTASNAATGSTETKKILEVSSPYSNVLCNVTNYSYVINVSPNVKELYVYTSSRKAIEISLNIVVQGNRTSDLKLTIENIQIKANSGHHAILMNSDKSLYLYSYNSSITGSDTLMPTNGTLTQKQGSSAIYCKHLVICTSVTLKGGSNSDLTVPYFVGGVAVSLLEGGTITLQSGNVNIIGGDCLGGSGVAGYAVYANNKNYSIKNSNKYNNVVVSYGTGTKPSTPPYIGY